MNLGTSKEDCSQIKESNYICSTENTKKKKGKLELLPEKYKGIIDDIKNDRA